MKDNRAFGGRNQCLQVDHELGVTSSLWVQNIHDCVPGEGSWAAHARLAELGDVEVDNTWLWRLNPHQRPTLEPEEYVGSIQLRLGCAGPTEPVACAACQSGLTDSGAAHATCCALGEATRGHNAATTLIHAAAQSCDHTTEMEVPGLIPGTDLRPADVLTSTLGNAHTALDISICSPHALPAGPDCSQSRLVAKPGHCCSHLPSLLRHAQTQFCLG